ncbi:MAG: 2-phosphosulfolactate phosphatase [Solirubrobacteraceae bacterium]|jgi:2-phosphosulfolactate phosphatase|nr:2-phosphosulfolactate phosphatase [Solirubrobacteraceae bacterium]
MIDVAFLGTQVRAADTAVVIDVLRATSTITLALASGYERVLVAGSIDEAKALRADGRVLAGEVGCARAPGFDLGNSPEETLEPRGTELVLATTNGAPAIVGSAELCGEVLAASMLNLEAVAAQITGGDVLLVCAGTDGRVSIEDVYLAGRLSALLEGPRTDAAHVAEAVAAAYPTPLAALEASGGAVGLRREGLESDIVFCAQESIVGVVPRLTGTREGIAILKAMPAGASVDDAHAALAASKENT